MVSKEILHELFYYNPETGVFVRKVKAGNRVANTVAGCKTPAGYLVIRVNKILYPAHVLAWIYFYGEMPPSFLDHINQCKSDNRIANLRLCNKSQNAANSPLPKNNTSGFKGVSFHKQTNKWRARSKANGVPIYLGIYETKEAAYSAYVEFMKNQHKEFANNL